MLIRNQRQSGFTLIELMIVVAIIAIVTAVALPKMMSARLSANENAAVANLRTIAAAFNARFPAVRGGFDQWQWHMFTAAIISHVLLA